MAGRRAADGGAEKTKAKVKVFYEIFGVLNFSREFLSISRRSSVCFHFNVLLMTQIVDVAREQTERARRGHHGHDQNGLTETLSWPAGARGLRFEFSSLIWACSSLLRTSSY